MKHLAGEVGLALVLAVLSADARALGTLFYTPDERQAIVRGRQDPLQEAETAPLQQARLDGVMHRPQGALAWFDGRPYRHGDAHPLGRVRILPDAVRLGNTTLLPGETVRADGVKLPAPKLHRQGATP